MRKKRKTLVWRFLFVPVALAMLVPVTLSVVPVPVVQAADTGWQSPGADGADTAAGDGDGFETNPEGAYADEGGYASNEDGPGDRHLYYDFEFDSSDIPADAIITGIEVRLDGWADSTDNAPQYDVDLSWNGGGNWSNVHSAALEAGSATVPHILGDQSDLWGHAWSASEFYDANNNFRVRITSSASTGGDARDFYLDWVAVRVYYLQPGIELTKTADPTMVNVGDTVDYTITVDNIGDSNLYYVIVDDHLTDCDLIGPVGDDGGDGVLETTETWEYTCSVTAGNDDIENTATVEATDEVSGTVTDADTAFVDVIHPAIEIAKTPDNQMVRYGGTANFTIVVTNIGDVALTENIYVQDIRTPNCNWTITDPYLPLEPEESFTYPCSHPNVTADFTNEATVTTMSPVGSEVSDADTAFVNVINPAIEIAKTPDSQMVRYGETATFTITVSNTGDVPLTNVQVTDALAPDCDAGPVSLGVGEGGSYTCTVENVQADFTNTAIVAGTPPVGPDVSDSDTASVEVLDSAIEIAKTPDNQMVRYNSTADFTIAITNTNDMTLTNVIVTDPWTPDCDRTVGTLGIGDFYTYTCSHPNVTADFINTAIVTGTPPVGPDMSDMDTAFVDVISPSIEIAKTPDTQTVDYYSTVIFTISVTNTGDVALTNVTVSDPQAPDCSRTVGDLIVGEDDTYTCAAVNVTNDLTNIATASGTPPVGPDVIDSDTAFVDVIGPDIKIAKTPNSQIVSHDSTVTFTIAVTNTGEVPLTNVIVSDALAPNCAQTVGTLTVGEDRVYTCTLANVTTDFYNTAIVTGTPPVGPIVSDSDVAFVNVVNPYIRIVKMPNVQMIRSGSTAAFTITVINTSDVTLSNVTVSDPQSPNCAQTVGTLAAGNDHTYTCTVAGVLDDFVNSAVVTGTPPVGPDVSDLDIAVVNVINPGIEIVKTPDTQAVRHNATVTFTITIINTGDVSLTDVIVTDDLAPNCNALHGTLDPSENWEYTCTFIGAMTDFTNTAIVTGTPSVGDDVTDIDTAFVDVIDPAIEISKTPDTQMLVSGSTAIFTIAITNTGDTPLTDVAVSDALAPNCTRLLGDLDPGEDTSYECVRANVTADFTNSATVTGMPSDGDVVTGTDKAFVDVINPSIEVAKTPDTQAVVSGSTATFFITVTNAGDVPLTDVNVSDALTPHCTRSLDDLDPGEYTSYECARANVMADFVNTAVASGTPPVGDDVTDADTATVYVTEPAPSSLIYLPLVMQNFVIAPDLVVEQIIVTSNSAQVVIMNQGNGPVPATGEVWIDLYIDPVPIPWGVNQLWWALCDYGIAWHVMGAPALPLPPGGMITLTIDDAYYSEENSRLPGAIPAGTPIYVQVDSYGFDYGAVLESHEVLGGSYNNIGGPVFSTSAMDERAAEAKSSVASERQFDSSRRLPFRP